MGAREPDAGQGAAGRGLEAVADEDEAFSLVAELSRSRSGRRRYVLRVVGQSMTGARIEHGDLLVVEEDEDPPDAEIVVALSGNGDEVTVKKLYRGRGMVKLRPMNGDHGDMVVPAEHVRIREKVKHVIHPPLGEDCLLLGC